MSYLHINNKYDSTDVTFYFIFLIFQHFFNTTQYTKTCLVINLQQKAMCIRAKEDMHINTGLQIYTFYTNKCYKIHFKYPCFVNFNA